MLPLTNDLSEFLRNFEKHPGFPRITTIRNVKNRHRKDVLCKQQNSVRQLGQHLQQLCHLQSNRQQFTTISRLSPIARCSYASRISNGSLAGKQRNVSATYFLSYGLLDISLFDAWLGVRSGSRNRVPLKCAASSSQDIILHPQIPSYGRNWLRYVRRTLLFLWKFNFIPGWLLSRRLFPTIFATQWLCASMW